MTRSNTAFMLRRAYERLVSSIGAIAVTALMVASVNAQAASPTPRPVTASVTILVPTVTIELVDDVPAISSVHE